jgi:CBS domain containing-hemolysin-like protein
MAIVVNEFGAAVGMITMEDIVEEVVGEIDVGYDFDEYLPKRKRTIEVVGEDVWVLDARLPISDTNEILGLSLQGREFHTVGGLVTARLRRIPDVGEFVDEEGYRFTVVDATTRAIEKVRVERPRGAGLHAGAF